MNTSRRAIIGLAGASAAGYYGYKAFVEHEDSADATRRESTSSEFPSEQRSELAQLREKAEHRKERRRNESTAIARLDDRIADVSERLITASNNNNKGKVHTLRVKMMLLLYERGHTEYQLATADWTTGVSQWNDERWKQAAADYFLSMHLFTGSFYDWKESENIVVLKGDNSNCFDMVAESKTHAGHMSDAATAYGTAAYYYANDQPAVGDRFASDGQRNHEHAQKRTVHKPTPIMSCIDGAAHG